MSESEFKDEEFMTAIDKAKVLKAWVRFLKSGFKFEQFSDRLYKHLTLHCSFIAHYNRAGFFDVYFTQPEATLRFMNQFWTGVSAELGMTWWMNEGQVCADLNRAMMGEATFYHATLPAQLAEAVKARDLGAAEALLKKHGRALPAE